MNGLTYILFVNETPHKELAAELGVTAQMVNSWVKGVKPIASKHLPKLTSLLGVEEKYFQIPLTLQDKVEIELQLASKSGKYESVDYQAAVLHKKNQAVKEKYMELLKASQKDTKALETVFTESTKIQTELTKLVQIPSIAEDPEACEQIYSLLKNIQTIRKVSK
ncbi:helix-turn-helix domain-containing protein [Bacillus cereus group sp. MYBK15-3]|uniref:helix-turn-helix domain-containing protein n=1 Tax=unclassified Bacillus cereus group TaxID=2750818 RepID=UPI003F7981FF